MKLQILPCLLALFGFTLTTQAAQQPPNIVLIISDDQAWTDYGFMGHPDIQTPNLDKLAKRSLVCRTRLCLCRTLPTIARNHGHRIVSVPTWHHRQRRQRRQKPSGTGSAAKSLLPRVSKCRRNYVSSG